MCHMFSKSIKKTVPITLGFFLLGACASVENTDVTSQELAVAPAEAVAPSETVTSVEPAVSAKTVAATEANESSEPRMVCRRQKVVGSNLRKKICLTEEQWERERSRSRKATEEFKRRPNGTAGGG